MGPWFYVIIPTRLGNNPASGLIAVLNDSAIIKCRNRWWRMEKREFGIERHAHGAKSYTGINPGRESRA